MKIVLILLIAKFFKFDLYRIPFNNGKGGKPEPLKGASNNGMSNYFAKYSPMVNGLYFVKLKVLCCSGRQPTIYYAGRRRRSKKIKLQYKSNEFMAQLSPNSRWLVFSSKQNSAYTQLFLTHIDEKETAVRLFYFHNLLLRIELQTFPSL
jgi:hypothetical protein